MSLGLRTAAWLGTGCVLAVSWGPAAHPPDRGGGRRGAAAPARVRPQGGQGRGVGTAAAGDRPEEKQKLVAVENDRAGAFSYLRKLGGRPLATTATLENAPKRYKDQLASPALGGYADVFQMNVMSTRSTSVAINRWQVTDVTCQKSTGHTVVLLPEQGGASYEGLQLHIPPLVGEPVLTDETEGQGEPYFSTHVIEVGGGQPSGNYKVHAIAPWSKSCQWGIKVRYIDPYQTERWVQLKDSNGKPLRIRTDSIPTDARETWGLIVQPWRLCDRSGKCIVHPTT